MKYLCIIAIKVKNHTITFMLTVNIKVIILSNSTLFTNILFFVLFSFSINLKRKTFLKETVL